ncbi:MAG TPA: two-component regulator propeller domain-containing protein [Burkholderiaceae bacterium]
MRSLFGPLLALLIWLPASAHTVTPDTLRFSQLQFSRDSKISYVNNIVQDTQGYIWIAGQSGMRRYDGHRIKAYRSQPDDPSMLANDTVRRLLVDEDGAMWLATASGLQRWDPATETFISYLQPKEQRKPGSLTIRSLVSDNRGSIWFGTNGGLHRIDRKSGAIQHVELDPDDRNPARNRTVIGVARDAGGNIWAARFGRIFRVDRQTGAIRDYDINLCAPQKAEPGAPQVRSLLVDGDQLWVAKSTGLERWNVGGDAVTCGALGTLSTLSQAHVVTMFRDAAGDVWLGVDEAGLYRWRRDGRALELHEHSDSDAYSISANNVLAITQDRSGTLWVGTMTGGVNHTDLVSGGFARLTYKAAGPAGLSSNRLARLRTSRDGKLWIGTFDAGMDLYDPVTGSVQNFRLRERVPHGRTGNVAMLDMAYDHAGRIWFGTENGLYRYDEKTRRFHGPRLVTEGSYGNLITIMETDHNGVIWVATGDGLRRFDARKDTVTLYKHDPAKPDSISGNGIPSLMMSRSGMLWIGTHGGMDLLDPDTGKVQHLKHPMLKDLSSGLYESPKGEIWVGLRHGVTRLTPDGASFRVKHFPVGVTVGSITAGDDGRIWAGTDKGLVVIDPLTERLSTFTPDDGLVDGTLASNSVQALKGTLYFGSFTSGLTLFKPDQVRRNPSVPAIAITDIQIDNRALRKATAPPGVRIDTSPDLAKSITLSHEQSTLAVEFSAMHYAETNRNAYAYRLDGYDTRWQSTDASRPFALYGKLPPGRYRFLVHAANKDSVWSTTPAALEIEVTPAFWATPWFRVLCTLLLLTLLWVAYRVRVRMLMRKQAQLERTVQSRTAQAQEALQQLKETQQQLVFREKMASVGTLTAGIAHEINNPANFAHAGAQLLNEELEHFRGVLRELAGDDTDAEVVRAIESHFANLFSRTGTIVEGTTRIRDLVKDLRTFARLDEAEKKEVDLIASLESTIRLVRAKYERIAAIVTDFQVKPRLECWPAQLNQVFMNVIVNACQAIEDRQHKDGNAPPGKLTIRSRQEGDICVLEFEDNGCGMKPDVLERVFEPFYTTKDVGSGTGLGLSISFGIVARHNGTITARSQPGAGTCFTVRLPMQVALEPDPAVA